MTTATIHARAAALLQLLHAECDALVRERNAYKSLDTEALLSRLTERAAFVDITAERGRALLQSLDGVARDADLIKLLADVRRAARTLFALEAENKALIERTRAVLSGVLDAVAPAAKTYDLRGMRKARPIDVYARVSRRV